MFIKMCIHWVIHNQSFIATVKCIVQRKLVVIQANIYNDIISFFIVILLLTENTFSKKFLSSIGEILWYK